MEILIKVIQVILALSMLVAFHELGHCLFAKLFGTRVEKFYLFFNPQISLIKFKRFDGKLHCRVFSRNGDDWDNHTEATEYGIGWVPFGGYCKIAGMVDESMDMEALKKEPQPWEFRSKKAWQRFWIMFGGVFFNFILAFVLYSAILCTWGDDYLKVEDAVYGIATNDLSYEIGFRDGDRILSIGGVPTDNFANMQADLIRSRATEAEVLRNGEKIKIDIDPIYIPAMLKSPGMFQVAMPFVILETAEGSINADADLQKGDKVISVNGRETSFINNVKKELEACRGGEAILGIVRGEETVECTVKVDTAGMMQCLLDPSPAEALHITHIDYTFFSAIPAGAVKLWKTIVNYVKELGLIFSPKTEAYKSVGSFIAIGKIFPATWDWFKFWTLSALFSVMLGVLNLLPIPGLDGGHILFLIVEMITGRTPGDKFLQVAETIGLILLGMLMILAFGNDIRGLFH